MMARRVSNPLRWLVVVIVADVVVASVTRLASLSRLMEGGNTWADYVGAGGLLLLAPIVVLSILVWGDAVRLSDRAALDKTDLHAMASTSHEWLWRTDADLVLTSCSRAVADMLGFEREEMIGRYLLDFLHPDDLATACATTDAARQHGTGWNDVELRWRHRDGSTERLQGSGVVVVDASGSVVGFRGARRPAPSGMSRQAVAESRARVQELLSSRGLGIALQPIVGTLSGSWIGVEALARFPDGRGPDSWFADAASAGLSADLELVAIQSALGLLDELPDSVSLSLNASPTMILDPRLRCALAPLGHALERITLEITEHAAVSAYDDIRDALLPLREAGMRLAIDDTGAGYASFAHVLRLRPDVIKIDRSLIAGVDADPGRRALVSAIVLLARELHASVTAEGVETLEEFSTVASLGVDHAQGYLLAKPTVSAATWGSWRQPRRFLHITSPDLAGTGVEQAGRTWMSGMPRV